MMKKNLRIVYMGTPDFAVPSLEILIENGFDIVGVITAPDKPAGRGLKLRTSPVKQAAEKAGLRILQPTNLKSPEFQEELRSLNANLQVVVAFRMLPEAVWSMPEFGTFNLHASLLPKYRGAAPINWAVINGEKETGLTTFFLKHEIDTGNIIAQVKEPIHEDDTAGSLYMRLMHKGAELVLETVKNIETDDVQTSPQKFSEDIPKAPKIFKADCLIDWNRNTSEIYNFIRGLSPYPTAWTQIHDKGLKVFMAEKDICKPEKAPGQVISDGKQKLGFYTKDGIIWLTDVQLESKKRMPVTELLKGFKP
jgi:methionyl-tRNA formyltransferase